MMLAQIASQATQAEQDAKRRSKVRLRWWIARRSGYPKPEGQPEAIVVLSNADIRWLVLGNDDRFEVVPQVLVNEVTGAEQRVMRIVRFWLGCYLLFV